MYYNDQAQVIYHYGNVSFYYPSDNVTYNVPFYKSQNDVGIITSSIPSDYNFGTYNGEAPVAVSWYALGAIQVYYENNYRYVTLAH